jgi:hypothetical protein
VETRNSKKGNIMTERINSQQIILKIVLVSLSSKKPLIPRPFYIPRFRFRCYSNEYYTIRKGIGVLL